MQLCSSRQLLIKSFNDSRVDPNDFDSKAQTTDFGSSVVETVPELADSTAASTLNCLTES